MIGRSPILTSSLEIMEHAIDHLKKRTGKDARFAVLHADNAVELVLKEVARVNGVRLIDKKGRSISYYDCVDELGRTGIAIAELPDIDLLHTERNSIYHLGNKPDKDKAEWLVYDVALGFIKRICNDELGYDVTNFSSAFRLSSEVRREIELAKSEIVSKYLHDAIAALNSGMYDATVFFAYTGIEAVVRETMPSGEIRTHRDMYRLMQERIPEDLLYQFTSLRKIRNEVAHGVSKSDESQARIALEVFERIVRELGDNGRS